MTLAFQRVAVLGATGPTGRALVHELLRRGIAVRAVSRAMAKLAAAFPYQPVEKRGADARDVVGLSAALSDCDLVIDCIGLPFVAMDDYLVTARTLAAVLKATGARSILVSNSWSYMPVGALPLSETHPRQGGPVAAQARRQAEDVLREVGSAIVHLPDFFGPHAHSGLFQMAIMDVARGGEMRWVGNPYQVRDYIYVPDAMRICADLAVHERAYGQDWIAAGSGPITAMEFATILSRLAARVVEPHCAAMPVLRALSLFDSELRGFLDIAPEYFKPVSYDDSKLAGLVAGLARTPYEAAIGLTLGWHRDA